jgi:ABC-2 type transport system ATP-binding protein
MSAGNTVQQEPVIRARDLSRRFGDFVAVDRVSLDVYRGEIFGFLGPNGAGKSTTIRMLCGILAPTSGQAIVGGFDVTKEPDRVKERIGYMSQRFSLYPDLTVAENIRFYGGIYGLSPERVRERGLWAVEMAGLRGREHQLTRELAGGWKQRLALGCAILHEPPMLFLDEPTSGVDPISRRQFWDLIYRLAGNGTTVFVTTHFLDEAEHCNRLVLIYRGKVIALGSPDELKRTAIEGTLLAVRCGKPDRAAELLKQVPGIRQVAMFGSAVHVLIDDLNAARSAIGSALEHAGVSVSAMETISPSLEDVFINLIEKADREPAENGTEQRT